jgi:aryl-alcohol dehydrogenase-like predicted oxidoreductase
MEAFIRLKEQGKIRAAGVCNHTAEEMKQAEEDICLTANKLVYGMLDRRIEKDVIPYCLEKKKSILAYRSLQRGLLTGRDLPKFLGPAEPYREVAFYEPENISRIRSFLDNIRPIANDHGADVTQLCIRWAMDQAGISAVLLAASSAEQIVYDAKAMDILLSEGEMNAIDGFLAELESTLELEPKAEALAANPS